MKAIVTVIGEDKVGIIAGVSSALAENNVNILDISQTVMREYFTMIMLVELSNIEMSFVELSKRLDEKAKELGVSIKIQREDIFKSMHHL